MIKNESFLYFTLVCEGDLSMHSTALDKNVHLSGSYELECIYVVFRL